MTGEFGWQGGLILKGGLVPGGKSGTWITAFSGGPSEDDVKVSWAGVDALVGN